MWAKTSFGALVNLDGCRYIAIDEHWCVTATFSNSAEFVLFAAEDVPGDPDTHTADTRQAFIRGVLSGLGRAIKSGQTFVDLTDSNSKES